MARPVMNIRGERELRAALLELGRTFGGPALDASMRKGMTVFRKSARANLLINRSLGAFTPPQRRLISNLFTEKAKGRKRSNPKFYLGGRNRGKKIAHLVEFGTAPHFQPKRNRMHPGARARPFMRPAFDSNGDQVLDFIMKDLRGQVIKQAARLRARNKRR